MLLVFGSINADLVFRVATLPVPGETVLCPGYAVVPGGKGANQAAAAAKAGAEVRFVGTVGDDGFGALLRRNLEQAGVDGAGLAVGTAPTGTAVIAVDDRGENAIIVASGANLLTGAEQVADLDLGPGLTLLCQNEVRPAETFALIRRAAARGARTILNLAPATGAPDEVLACLDTLVVNRVELGMLLAADPADPVELARRFVARHGRRCVVTLGSEGAVGVEPGGGWRVPALPVEPVDTTGAGDTFAGVFATALDQGRAFEEALRRASVAAALACEAVGAQAAQPDAARIGQHLARLGPSRPLDGT